MEERNEVADRTVARTRMVAAQKAVQTILLLLAVDPKAVQMKAAGQRVVRKRLRIVVAVVDVRRLLQVALEEVDVAVV
jgi:hypothetical protein